MEYELVIFSIPKKKQKFPQRCQENGAAHEMVKHKTNILSRHCSHNQNICTLHRERIGFMHLRNHLARSWLKWYAAVMSACAQPRPLN